MLAATQDDFEIKPGPSKKQNESKLHTDENKPSKQPVEVGDIEDGNKNSSEDFFDDDIDGKYFLYISGQKNS